MSSENMMNDKRKILFFLNRGVGGAERAIVTIAKMLPTYDFDVKFVIIGKSIGNIAQFIPQRYDIRLLHVSNMWEFLILKMIRILRSEKPHAVFCSSMHYNSRLILAAKFVGKIKIIIRNCNYMSHLRWDKMAMVRLTYHKADWIIAQQEEMSDEIISTLPKVSPSKVITLHNPIDTETIDKDASAPNPFPYADDVNYVCVARFSYAKGQDVLARAFIEVTRVNPKARLWFIGKYEENSDFACKVKSILKNSGCMDKAHFVGYDSNPYRWMKHCDCFVLPSRREGLPNVLLEAQYLGIPCVASTCIPIIERIIIDGGNGYNVPSGDYRAMAKAMIKAVDLRNIKMIYRPADNSQFIHIFE